MEGNEMTAKGLESLRAEIEDLETRGRREIAAQIKTAREWGDLSENAEYHAAKNAQALMETKISQLRERERNAVVVKPSAGGDTVAFGSKVEIEFEETGRRQTFTLVSSQDAKPAAGLLSSDSPMAGALRGKKAGETAKVKTPGGEKPVKILSVG